MVLHLEAVNPGGPVPAELIQGFNDRKARQANAAFGGAISSHEGLAFEELAEVVDMGPLLVGGMLWPTRHTARR